MAILADTAGKFDWYAATINVGVDSLRQVLAAGLVPGSTVEPVNGEKHGYHFREEVRSPAGETLATILHGGNGDIPHAYASSDYARDFAPLIRANWPDRHRVSRFDCALDFDEGPGTFERLLSVCHYIADGERDDDDQRKRVAKVRTRMLGDWHHAERGRTFYLGSQKSAVQVRLYEKGLQLVAEAEKRGIPRPDVSVTSVRLEVQVRPAGDAKSRAAYSSPDQVFGYSEWSRELFRRVTDLDVERVDIKERREPDHDRALGWMLKQYESHILTEVAAVGGWEALGEALRVRMETGAGLAPEGDSPF